MPSPIAHSTAGYVVYRLLRKRLRGMPTVKLGPVPLLLAITIGFSHLPDLDFLIGILVKDIGAFHNGISHSLAFGVAVALGIAAIARLRMKSGFVQWFLIALFCYEAHILLDYFTYSRGIMAFWPISMERYHSPTPLFYGLRWSEGLISTSHLKTLAGEMVFASIVSAILFVLTKIGLLAPTSEDPQESKKRFSFRQASSD